MIPPLTFFMLLPDNDFDDFGSLPTFVRFETVLVLDLVAIKFSFLSLVLVNWVLGWSNEYSYVSHQAPKEHDKSVPSSLELLAIKVEVDPLLLHQTEMISDLPDCSPVHNYDQVSISNGAQSMRDNQGGTILHNLIKILLNGALAFRIKCAGGFVENQYPRFLK